jgi:S-formylglutathione hydrolase FrmB
MASGPKYWTFVSEELPALMRQFFPISTAREDTFAAGLSMGGYGALRLGLARPDKFAAAASLSGALDYVKRLREAGREGSRFSRAEWVGLAGAEFKGEGTSSDLFATAQRVAADKAPRPKLYICCGTEDALLEDNRGFHQHLDTIHYEHTYEESPGTHEWGYWDAQIRKVLDWLPLRS